METEQKSLIENWREKVQKITTLTRDPTVDSEEITTLLLDAYRSGRRIERMLGKFPGTLEEERQSLIDSIAELWRACKMHMVNLLVEGNIEPAKVMRMRLRTMCKIGESLGFLDRLPGHEQWYDDELSTTKKRRGVRRRYPERTE